MITIAQIRAARALLNWSQSDLAEFAGLSQTGIARIENGTNKPNSRTIDKIATAFDHADIEFIDDSGVKKRMSEVKILHGADAMRQMFNEVYQAAKDDSVEICMFNGVPSRLTEWVSPEWFEMHTKRMSALNTDFKYKIIVRKGEISRPASNYAEYKFFPEHLFNEKTICIFGDKVYFRDYTKENLRMVRIEQKEIAKSMKVLFDIAWNSVAEDFSS